MLVIVGLFGVFALLIGLATLVSPSVLLAMGRSFANGPGVWGGFLIRGVVAVAIWLAAPESATPGAFRVLAVLFAIGAVTLPLLGARRFERVVEWGARRSAGPLRLMGLLAAALGGFLLWSTFS